MRICGASGKNGTRSPGGRPFSDETREALSRGQKRRRAIEALLRDRAGKRVRLDEDAERQPDWKLTVKQLAKSGISIERYGPKNKLYMRIPSRKEQGLAKLPDVHSSIVDSFDDRQGTRLTCARGAPGPRKKPAHS